MSFRYVRFHPLILIAVAGILIGSVATLSAQPPGPPGGPGRPFGPGREGPGGRGFGDFEPGFPGGAFGGRGRLSPIMKALDQDEDGKLSAAEIDQASASLRELDTNHDGQLEREEMRLGPDQIGDEFTRRRGGRGDEPDSRNRGWNDRENAGAENDERESSRDESQSGGRAEGNPADEESNSSHDDRSFEQPRRPREGDVNDKERGRLGGGGRFGRGGGFGGPGGPPGGGVGRMIGGFGGMMPGPIAEVRKLMEGDDKITKEEAMARLEKLFEEHDSNTDGAIDRQELQSALRRQMNRNRSGGGRPEANLPEGQDSNRNDDNESEPSDS